MRADYDTNGYTQWFFFRISSLRKGQYYKFNIMNMMKPNSFYNQGMKVLCYPVDPFNKGVTKTWRRDGENIAYYRNGIQRKPGLYYYTLTFTLEATSQIIYIASDYPYRYTDLKNFIKEHCSEDKKDIVRMMTLCETLAGNVCPLLIITQFNSTAKEIAQRPAIIFTARVHPG